MAPTTRRTATERNSEASVEQTNTAETVRMLDADGVLSTDGVAEEYLQYIERLTDAQLQRFHRDMVVTRRIDVEATNLQKQGEMGLWVQSLGQEAAQVGSAHAARPQRSEERRVGREWSTGQA